MSLWQKKWLRYERRALKVKFLTHILTIPISQLLLYTNIKKYSTFRILSILWHFSQTCKEHVYEKTLQNVVGARFSYHHCILYVTVCMYMNLFATIVFLMWSFKIVFYSCYSYSIFVTIKLCIVNKIDVGISELSLYIYLKKHLRVAETDTLVCVTFCENSKYSFCWVHVSNVL